MSQERSARPALAFLDLSIERCQGDIARRIKIALELKCELERNDAELARSRSALEDLERAVAELGRLPDQPAGS